MPKTNNLKLAGAEQSKQAVLEQLWLHYYNQTLFDKGLISEQDYTRMKTKISSWKALLVFP